MRDVNRVLGWVKKEESKSDATPIIGMGDKKVRGIVNSKTRKSKYKKFGFGWMNFKLYLINQGEVRWSQKHVTRQRKVEIWKLIVWGQQPKLLNWGPWTEGLSEQ